MSIDVFFILKAIIIAIVEGITEFLPVSSTGHMIIVGHFIDFKGDFAKSFEIIIQLGAILAILVLYRKRIIDSLKTLSPGGAGFKLWTGLIIAFIPVGIVGLLFQDIIEDYLMTPTWVAAALVVGGIWMIIAENKYRKNSKIQDIGDVGYKESLAIGCFQCLAILWPGFSRSGATIIGGWVMGLSSVTAAEYSFFLAIPTMFAITGYKFVETMHSYTLNEAIALITGFVVSFFVAWIVVDKFIKFLQTKPMRSFAIYRIIVGFILLLMAFFQVL